MAPPAAVQKRVDELRRLISRHDRLHYALDRPEIGDAESPTRRVAGQVWDAFATVEHLAPMLSLENAASEADLAEFEARIKRALPGGTFTYVCERVVDSRSYPQGGSAAMSWVP